MRIVSIAEKNQFTSLTKILKKYTMKYIDFIIYTYRLYRLYKSINILIDFLSNMQ